MNTPGLHIPPQAVEVEKHVIGAMLLNQEATGDGLRLLEVGDFYLERHGLIFGAMKTLFSANTAADILTVSAELRRVGKHEQAGRDDYLMDISSEVVSSANIVEYAGIVKDKSLKRKQIALATNGVERGYSEEAGKDTQEYLEREVFSLGEKSAKKKDLRHINEVLVESMAAIQARLDGKLVGLATGIPALDKHLGGMQAEDLIVLGGRPMQGKTSLAGQIAINVAKAGKSVAFFECEMTGRAVVDRALFAQAGINHEMFRQGNISQREIPKLAMATGPMSTIPFWIDDSAGITPMQIRTKCRRLLQREGLDLIVVDNIQRMASDSGARDTRVRVSECSSALKEIAKEFNVPVIGISHIRRLQGGEAQEPTIADLQEAGNIEQDADVIMLIHRADIHKEVGAEEKGKAKIIFGKFREGSLGYVDLFFEKTLTTFYDWDNRPQPEFERRDWV